MLCSYDLDYTSKLNAQVPFHVVGAKVNNQIENVLKTVFNPFQLVTLRNTKPGSDGTPNSTGAQWMIDVANAAVVTKFVITVQEFSVSTNVIQVAVTQKMELEYSTAYMQMCNAVKFKPKTFIFTLTGQEGQTATVIEVRIQSKTLSFCEMIPKCFICCSLPAILFMALGHPCCLVCCHPRNMGNMGLRGESNMYCNSLKGFIEGPSQQKMYDGGQQASGQPMMQGGYQGSSFCSRCGTQLAPGSHFCSKCAHPVPQAQC